MLFFQHIYLINIVISFFLQRFALFVYNHHNQGGENRARPRRTANFAVQSYDVRFGNGVGRVGGDGDNDIQHVPIESPTNILFNNNNPR